MKRLGYLCFMRSHNGDDLVEIDQVLAAHPAPHAEYASTLARCLAACLACEQACVACADACVAEGDPALGVCIQRALDCAAVCSATVSVLSRQASTDPFVVRTLLLACGAAAAACAVECLQHQHEHCRLCAQSCRTCERACLAMTEEPRL